MTRVRCRGEPGRRRLYRSGPGSEAATALPFSTLSFLPGETARAAVELLVDRIEGREGDHGRLFSADFQIRASSVFPSRRPAVSPLTPG
ncbi:hypothetical protein ABZ260_29490 [Streptosporangium sp. NPDC006013]|uniref:hypothetical protein n=1 Tax=Streptosporangium sp. NPDC006013 TaxID=3155596 RepID=UPI0033BF93B6